MATPRQGRRSYRAAVTRGDGVLSMEVRGVRDIHSRKGTSHTTPDMCMR